jgi:hypothetical protein
MAPTLGAVRSKYRNYAHDISPSGDLARLQHSLMFTRAILQYESSRYLVYSILEYVLISIPLTSTMPPSDMSRLHQAAQFPNFSSLSIYFLYSPFRMGRWPMAITRTLP